MNSHDPRNKFATGRDQLNTTDEGVSHRLAVQKRREAGLMWTIKIVKLDSLSS